MKEGMLKPITVINETITQDESAALTQPIIDAIGRAHDVADAVCNTYINLATEIIKRSKRLEDSRKRYVIKVLYAVYHKIQERLESIKTQQEGEECESTHTQLQS